MNRNANRIRMRTLIILVAITLQVPCASAQNDFDELDSNKDGAISWPEYSRRLPLVAQGRIHSEVFQEADLDGNGQLSPAELYSLQNRLEQSTRARYGSPQIGDDIAPTPTPDPLLMPIPRDLQTAEEEIE